MISVFYDANAIFMGGDRDRVYPAGSLRAFASGNSIIIENLHSTQALVDADFSQIADINGNGFGSVADCLTYLQGEFTKRRSLDVPVSTSVAAVAIAMGMPATISRQNGQLLPARADTYTQAFVAGLMAAPVAATFAGNVTRNPVTMADWTSIIGSQSLAQGQPYFLAPAGGMTTTPSLATGNACVHLGEAMSPSTFAFRASDPILL